MRKRVQYLRLYTGFLGLIIVFGVVAKGFYWPFYKELMLIACALGAVGYPYVGITMRQLFDADLPINYDHPTGQERGYLNESPSLLASHLAADFQARQSKMNPPYLGKVAYALALTLFGLLLMIVLGYLALLQGHFQTMTLIAQIQLVFMVLFVLATLLLLVYFFILPWTGIRRLIFRDLLTLPWVIFSVAALMTHQSWALFVVYLRR